MKRIIILAIEIFFFIRAISGSVIKNDLETKTKKYIYIKKIVF